MNVILNFLTLGSAGVIDSAAVEGLTGVFMDNLGVVLPVGITILGVMLGVSVIPKIIYKFF